ncbi:MAG: hypothetical protein IJB96_04150 [Lachnospira sp.]|nr:hypothetical protein [Lachnospira sp.]
MDIKEKIEQVVEKVKGDDSFKEQFKNDPIKAVESVLGVDLPDDVIEKVIDGVKAKVSLDSVSDAVSGIGNAIKNLF